jgi:Icc-related predicted phosphoesterase
MVMKVALIADTHGMLPAQPDADVLIHAGDIAQDMSQEHWFVNQFFPWCREFGNPVYATWGNHDWTQGSMGDILREKAPPNLDFVADEARVIGGKRFWFSPWSPVFGGWAWMLTEPQLASRYAAIPDRIEVIISHGPPKGAGDLAGRWTDGPIHVGSTALAHRMAQLKELELVVCGHIHQDMGYHSLNGVRVINCASVTEQYTPRERRYFYLEWDHLALLDSEETPNEQ